MVTLNQILRKIQTPQFKVVLLVLIVVAIPIFYINLIFIEGTILQDKVDWGIDMGYTMLGFGIVAFLISLFLLLYSRQQYFRNRTITKVHKTIFGTIIFFAVIGALLFAWLAHEPNIDFYNNDFWDWSPVPPDKFGHIFWSFIFTATILAVRPSKMIAILVWMGFTLWELLEIIIINNFGGTQFDKDVATVLTQEITDITLDLLANTIGWLLAVFVVVFILKKRFK